MPADHTGWRFRSADESLNRVLEHELFDVTGSTAVNSVNVTLNPAKRTAFYRMVYP